MEILIPVVRNPVLYVMELFVLCLFLVLTEVPSDSYGFILGPDETDPAQTVPCGTPVISLHSNRIIGGHEATPGSWPWMVMLEELEVQVCAGSIINERVVLTAAHCFEDAISQMTERWKAYVGKHHTNMEDPMETEHDIETIIIHPYYNNETLKHDIALLVLKTPIQYTNYVRPICIPPSTERVVPVGAMCYATGWGETKGTADRTVLNQVGLPFLSAYWCSRGDWYGSRFIFGYTFCAGYQSGGKDACTGDSGGPYNCKHDGKWYAQGITSWGYDCAQPHWPGIYTDVSKYGSWIRKTMTAAGYPLQE